MAACVLRGLGQLVSFESNGCLRVRRRRSSVEGDDRSECPLVAGKRPLAGKALILPFAPPSLVLVYLEPT